MATENEKINACILYLRSKGYEVHKRNDSRIGQWVAYKREGMEPILHGKVIADIVNASGDIVVGFLFIS